MAVKARVPAATAVKTAVRSAQQVSPNEAFSTLTPANTLPSAVRSAAPTGNDEYGTYAFADTWRARSYSSSS